MKKIGLLLVGTLSICSMPAKSAPVVPPKGGGAIFVKDPVWLTGIRYDDEKSATPTYAKAFPPATRTDHFKVVNSGFWIANQAKPSEVFYEFAVTVTKPFESRVFTRMILDNPVEPEKPIKYEHFLDPKERSTKATHGPLLKVKRNEKYSMTLEVFSDESRTMLIERVVQNLVAALDNSSGCVDLQPEVMLAAFPYLASSKVPIEKVMLACDR